MISVGQIAHAEALNPVARAGISANGDNSYVLNGCAYTYSQNELPVTDEISANSELRTVAYGNRVAFGFQGLSADAEYRVRAVFVSDHGGRAVRVMAGDTVLEENLALPDAKVINREWNIPAAAYADGKLTFAAERVAGPNAVLSLVEVFSDSPVKLQAMELPSAEETTPLTPQPADGGDRGMVSLNGTWDFRIIPENESQESITAGSEKSTAITVPGEWSMQGFTVPKGGSARYSRVFDVPAGWSDGRIKLRFNAVYSECRVIVKGKDVGGHEGGFTPFEVDVTDVVKAGSNKIDVVVKNESLADTLASGSKYAVHPLGGISRDVYLFLVPAVHIESLHLTTDLDENYRDATLLTEITAVNESGEEVKGVECRLTLRRWSAGDTAADTEKQNVGTIAFDAMDAGSSAGGSISPEITKPLKWDPEHPHLYLLRAELLINGAVVEVVEERFGFREVEVRGNRLFVNGAPVKLHGVCRHEVDPLRGRSLRPGQWRRDADIFIKGNCNFIRTSHYPPDEAFLDACDEMGLFVEDEAPFCWARQHNVTARILVVHETLEMVERDRNHPCVIFWSLGNESHWGAAFADSSKAVRRVEPSRPQIFSYGTRDLASWHYPALGGPAKVENAAIPTIFDEYCHLNAYNRFELVTDPGLRDAWGRALTTMWEKMLQSQGCLGGSLWAAIDDSFAMPDGTWVGYGTWGPIDGWRRPKPEYWHMKKTYTPVKLTSLNPDVPAQGAPLVLEVENRFMFANLNECKAEWKIEGAGMPAGCAGFGDIKPGAKGVLEIKIPSVSLAGKSIYLNIIGPRGFSVDEYLLPIGTVATAVSSVAEVEKPQLQERDKVWVVSRGAREFSISKSDGSITSAGAVIGGPHLMLLALNAGGGTQMTGEQNTYDPYTAACSNWKCEKVEAESTGDAVRVKIAGSYKEAQGGYDIVFNADGSIRVGYEFKVLKAVNPRQVGVVFDLPVKCDTLKWKRKGQWTVYPEDHIGRTGGTANAFKDMHECGPAGPRTKPQRSWSKDGNKLGSNDFRSTKLNIYSVLLTDKNGNGIEVESDGTQHARCWIDGNRTRLLIADYSNLGSERFLRGHAKLVQKPIKAGDSVKGVVSLRVR
jgi:hypothetical protein